VTVRLKAPTSGTRISVWLFPALTAYLGATYLFGPMERLQAPSYTAARGIMPLHIWGTVFVSVAIVKVGCLIHGTRRGFVLAMCFGIGLYSWWAFLFGWSLVTDPHTPLSAPAWPLAWVVAHIATLATMTRDKG
jgi:hypothetical protein